MSRVKPGKLLLVLPETCQRRAVVYVRATSTSNAHLKNLLVKRSSSSPRAMCRRTAGKSSLTAIYFKISIVLAVVLCLHLASGRNEIKKSRGSCLSYGHACWGGHGKRSGDEAPFARTNVAVPSDDPDARAKWFLSKLITPLELRYYGKKETDTTNGRSDVQDLLNEMEKDDGKRDENYV
ncbi:hypothetical protein GWI33_011702 [Rhynchophorus ferrugineus]|uniref:Uncharacterized protein n=1 Tax=Rhynchophorus ferrugineus TaxID=354439 RepID=A0A834MIM8_RHYFE|nr:hypothetical protein GWI33_011702 [Rhynchophorus ferrugineus]